MKGSAKQMGWVLGLRPIVLKMAQRLWENALRGGISKESYAVFTLVSEKTTVNSERLGRQARPGI